MEPDWSYEDYQRMHELEAECKRLEAECKRLRDTEKELSGLLADTSKRLLDLEAEHFADKLERDMDLETWDGIHAAHVGHDLEEVADKLIEAIEANRRGEDIDGLLFDIHGDVCSIIADNMRPEAEED